MTSPKTFHVKSFGCQMNVYDGARMAELLAAEGLSEAGEAAAADLVVLNTCHIRERAAEKVYSDIGRLIRRGDGTRPMIAVAGCVAQAEGGEIGRRAGRARARHRHAGDGQVRRAAAPSRPGSDRLSHRAGRMR